jgi:hypothetical protein
LAGNGALVGFHDELFSRDCAVPSKEVVRDLEDGGLLD